MAIYAISFRVGYEGDYDDRYKTLVAAIRAQAGGPNYWEESTSFFLLQSDSQPGELADAIIAGSDFDKTRDLLLVIYLSGKKGHALRGHYTDKDVIKLLAAR